MCHVDYYSYHLMCRVYCPVYDRIIFEESALRMCLPDSHLHKQLLMLLGALCVAYLIMGQGLGLNWLRIHTDLHNIHHSIEIENTYRFVHHSESTEQGNCNMTCAMCCFMADTQDCVLPYYSWATEWYKPFTVRYKTIPLSPLLRPPV